MAVLNRTAASLRVGGDSLKPDEISSLLGVEPTLGQTKGQVFVGKNTGKERVAKSGMWSLKAESKEPGDIESQILALLEITTDDLSIWKNISNRYSIDIFCGFFMESGNEGIEISPKALKALGDRNIELAMDIYGA